jgi:hypothetical protein
MLRSFLFAALALFISPAPAAPPVSATTQAPAAPVASTRSHPGIFVATIHSVDSASGMVSLLTGRGHALRIVQVLLPPKLEIKKIGAAVPRSELKPGAIVRVRFAEESIQGARQASAVDLMESQESGR